MSSVDRLIDALEKRIVVLDGAMGTMIQGLGFAEEAQWRGARYKDHSHALKGCSDLLALTQPKAIEDIHFAFLQAGADIVETNTFTGPSIALADYGLENDVRDINMAGPPAARRAADRAEKLDGKPRWVAGSIGPTTKTA